MKVYLVWHINYVNAYESSEDVHCVFDSKEKAAKYILNRANCTDVSVAELMKSEQLIIDSEDHFYTNCDGAPNYNYDSYIIDEYEVETQYDSYIPGLNTVKNKPIKRCFATVEYEDGEVNIIDDIRALSDKLSM